MKPAAAYLFRPIAIRAIQLPPADEDPTEEWKKSLHEILEGMEWESGRNGQLAVFFDGRESVIVANPEDWILRDPGSPEDCEPVAVMSDEEFRRRFMDAQLSDEHQKLEAERFLHHTTP